MMVAPTLTSELLSALKRLRLGCIAATLPERHVLADEQYISCCAFCGLLVLA